MSINKGKKDDVNAQDETPRVKLPLGKVNFIIMGVAALMIAVGFMLISGGAPVDGEFNPEVFSARRVVVGPLIAFLGFIAMGAGIMWKSKDNDKQ